MTHESLFKAWPTLDQWLTEEQAFLTDLERINIAHEEWSGGAGDEKSRALLCGLLLSRPRLDRQIPAAFPRPRMAELRAFVAASAEAEDTEKKIAAEQEAKVRRAERRVLPGRGSRRQSCCWAPHRAAPQVIGYPRSAPRRGLRHKIQFASAVGEGAPRICAMPHRAYKLALAALPSNLQETDGTVCIFCAVRVAGCVRESFCVERYHLFRALYRLP